MVVTWKRASWLAYLLVVAWLGFGWAGWQFILGNVIALSLGLVDRLVYAWWLYPFEQSSIQIQYWTRRKDVKAVLGLLTSPQLNQQKLLFKSLGFAVIWVLLALYVISSTGSIVAVGIVMGLGFDLVWQLLSDRKTPNRLPVWFCWQIKRVVPEKEAWRYGWIFIGLWCLFILQLVI